LLLSRAKYLKNDDYYAGVFLTKWLSDDELQRVREKRRLCEALNSKHGRKQFVVISGEIMEYCSDGRRRPYHPSKSIIEDVTHAAKLASKHAAILALPSSKSKNAKGGSHVAPSVQS
jgi:hypothetical protein